MDFHTIILDNRFLKRVHDLCNKYGLLKEHEKEKEKDENEDFLIDGEEHLVEETPKEFLPSENYHFYYNLESTGNTLETKPEYIEFEFENGLSEFIPLPPKIDKKNAFDEKTLYITIYDIDTVNILRKILGNIELHSNTPCIDIQDLYWSINDLRIKY